MTIGTDRLDRMISGTHVRSPCGEAMLLPVVCAYEHGYVTCLHTIDERFANSNKVVFGGYLAALVDDVSGHTAMTVIPNDKICSTAELSISFFRPSALADGELLLEGWLIDQKPRVLSH